MLDIKQQLKELGIEVNENSTVSDVFEQLQNKFSEVDLEIEREKLITQFADVLVK